MGNTWVCTCTRRKYLFGLIVGMVVQGAQRVYLSQDALHAVFEFIPAEDENQKNEKGRLVIMGATQHVEFKASLRF